MLELTVSKTDSSLQLATPTMIEPPSMDEFLLNAFEACNLVWNRMCIQLEFGGMTCCRTVPQEPNCCNTKLAAEGGNPQTVTHVAIGGESSQPLTSCAEQLLGVEGKTCKLVLLGVPKPGLLSEDLFGVIFILFISPTVGGPPGLSPGVRFDLFRVSFRSCGPLKG